MHVRDLVELAGLVAVNAPALACSRRVPDASHLEAYWAASKARGESWTRTLKLATRLVSENSPFEPDTWLSIRANLEEILVGEILTRVWTGVLVAADRRVGANTAEPIACNVLATHLEARHRVMALLVDGRGISTRHAVALNRLRLRAERWSDVLLASLWQVADVRQFAIEPERTADFAADLASEIEPSARQQSWRLTLVSLRNSFARDLLPLAANGSTNARIASTILNCFDSEQFDSTGQFHSPLMMRMTAAASDVQGLIDDLLGPGVAVGREAKAPRRRI